MAIVETLDKILLKLDEISDNLDGDGGGGAVSALIATETLVSDGGVDTKLDKTWQEIHDTIAAGQVCWVAKIDTEYKTDYFVQITECGISSSQYGTYYEIKTSDYMDYSAASATGTLIHEVT